MDGYMVMSGDGSRHYVDKARRHINLKQGVIGIKIHIMMPFDASGKNGCSIPLPDVITIKEPKAEEPLACPPKQGYAQNFNQPETQPAPQGQMVEQQQAEPIQTSM